MKKTILIAILTIIVIGFQTDIGEDNGSENKPEFKEALIDLLIQYPKARFNGQNDLGKIGLGIEVSPGGISFANYSSDRIDGRFEVFNRKTGKIQYIDSIINGTSVGPIFAYHENGNLAYSIFKIERADTLIKNRHYVNYRPTYKGYLTVYDFENKIIEEGTAFYDESIEIDFIKGIDWVEKK